eukprot:XP_011671794.1 PREDICTED: COP9 signalosome complex subunit 5 [Strongylocentrotus purpuratus]
MDREIAQKTWEMSNDVDLVQSVDEIYKYDKKQQHEILQAKPWTKENLEYKTFQIKNNACQTAWAQLGVGRLENAIGWYHSHPGYGCWLSGIDVGTQMLNQQFQEPFVAIVVDPVRTISAGKVNIGAFRTYPKGYKPPDDVASEYQTIPLNKIEDFGVHCKQYYSLEISYFKSVLDRKLLESLWNKYWVNTLSSSSLLTNADYTIGQVSDLSEKLENAESQLGRGSFMLAVDHEKKAEDKLGKATRDSCKSTIEVIHGLMSQVIKNKLFNQVHNR